MKSVPSLSAASAPENVTRSGAFCLLLNLQEQNNSSLNAPGQLNNLFLHFLIKCVSRLRSCTCLEGVKIERLSWLASCCHAVPQPAGLRLQLLSVWNVMVPTSPSCQVTSSAHKGAATLSAYQHWKGGAVSTVAHKRISPLHKDSGPNRVHKGGDICLSPRQEGVWQNSPGWRRWDGGVGGLEWLWGHNDRRGGQSENTRVTPFICSSLLCHWAPLAPSKALLLCLFTPRFLPIHTGSSDGSIGQILSVTHFLRPLSSRSMSTFKDRLDFLLMVPSFSDFFFFRGRCLTVLRSFVL